MLDSLKFVQGSVAKKDFVAALTHFRIGDGLIQGYNGALSLCCPIPVDLNCMPKASSFAKAVQTCKDTVSLGMTPSGRLSIKSGRFRALIDCIQDGFPDIRPEGKEVPLAGDILPAFKILEPFIGEDASRPWARGILLRGESAFATNNVILIERWLGHDIPNEINIPHDAVKEILRIGQEPTHLQIDDRSVTFHYGPGKWLRSQLYSTSWPDLAKILNAPSRNQEPLPDGFFEALEDLEPFLDRIGACYFKPSEVSTGSTDDSVAVAEIKGLNHQMVLNHKMISSLKGVASTIDFSLSPKPMVFYGDNLRGAIVGMRG